MSEAAAPPRALPPPVQPGRSLSDPGAVLLAVGAGLGAWFHRPFPLVVAVLVVAIALLARRPAVLVVGVALLAGVLGARSMAGMAPADRSPFDGVVTLVGDPQATRFGVRVDVRSDGRRLELEATDAASGAVLRSLAGERLQVQGTVRPPPDHAPWLVPRHVVGRLTVDRAERLDGGAAPWRAANRIRRIIEQGSEVIPRPDRSLYRGFVLGDDRDQPPEIVDDFRGSGLTHLLVVSGQNVAFVLVLASPVLDRLGRRGRWIGTLVVIAAFATVTRFEPSVLRASAMAALAVTARTAGRPSVSVRTLALAVTVLLLVDPLLVRSVAFQLSVGASLAIAVLAERIAAALPGPQLLARALGVILAAQIGVAPIIIPRFGGMPVASVPANLLAGPVAGMVTTWGLPAGLVAGIAGDRVAEVVHLPTRGFVAWVALVARIGAALPLGEVGIAHAVAIGLVVLVGWRLGARSLPMVLLLVVAIALAPALALRSASAAEVPVAGGTLHRSGGATVLEASGRAASAALLQDLRRAGVRRLDVVVLTDDGAEPLVASLRHRWPIGRVAGPGHEPLSIVVGGLAVSAGGGDPPIVRRR